MPPGWDTAAEEVGRCLNPVTYQQAGFPYGLRHDDPEHLRDARTGRRGTGTGYGLSYNMASEWLPRGPYQVPASLAGDTGRLVLLCEVVVQEATARGAAAGRGKISAEVRDMTAAGEQKVEMCGRRRVRGELCVEGRRMP